MRRLYDDVEMINLQTLLLSLSEPNNNDSNFTIKKCFESYRNFILFTQYSKSLFEIVVKKMIISKNLTDNEKSMLLQYCFYNNDIVLEIFSSIEIEDNTPYLFLEKHLKNDLITAENNKNLYDTTILINSIIRNKLENVDKCYNETKEETLERIQTRENSFIKPFIPLSSMVKHIKNPSNKIINSTGYKGSPYYNIANLEKNINSFLNITNIDEYNIACFGNINTVNTF